MRRAEAQPEPPSRPKDDSGRTQPLDPAAAEVTPNRERAGDTGSFHSERAPAPAEYDSSCPTSIPVPPDLVDHPRYCILEYLGSGGMGTVYKARHRIMDRLVALKVINPHLVDRPAMVDRFRREVRAAARLAHPNIMAAYDADQAGATHFLVMEFLDGVDMDRLLHEQGRLSVDRACAYVRQAALGLQHAWKHGMVHRDIKPHNLMLLPQGQIKILDFGLARFVSEAAPTTAPGALAVPPYSFKGTTYAYTGVGTADYIAPEEAVDARRADIRADIYSLGCTLYRCLTGQVPFPNGSLLDKLKSHQERTPEALTALCPEAPARLAQVVECMMAKDPADRFQTPAAVAQALLAFAVVPPASVLVVDDNAASRNALARLLESQGYPVTQAGNGQEALDQLRRAPAPGLILLDLLMPVMDGWQFLEQQKQDPVLASIPVVIISALNDNQATAIALGAADYLQKPIAVDELATKVHDYVAPE